MTYVTVHRSKIRFQVVIATILVLAFFLALILMFVHPTASLTVFFTGMALAGIAAVVVLVFGKAERTAAVGDLAQHHCPNCGAAVHHGGAVEGDWLCDACGSEFTPKGVEQV